jgi:hypothetical protein
MQYDERERQMINITSVEQIDEFNVKITLANTLEIIVHVTEYEQEHDVVVMMQVQDNIAGAFEFVNDDDSAQVIAEFVG